MTEVPEFRLPFTFVPSGGALEVEQDSDGDIQQCVWAILSYELGTRIDMPDFGLPEQVFIEGGADMKAIRDTILRWEPRAHELIEEDPTWLETMVQTITARRDPNG